MAIPKDRFLSGYTFIEKDGLLIANTDRINFVQGTQVVPHGKERVNVRTDILASGTSFPLDPVQNQMFVLETGAHSGATLTSEVSWLFRYNANSHNTSYPWEFIGGPPLTDRVETAETTTSTSFTDLATVGPYIDVPVAGFFHATWAVHCLGGGGNNVVGPKWGTSGTFNESSWFAGGHRDFLTGDADNYTKTEQALTSTANDDRIKIQYQVSTGTGTFQDRSIWVWPIACANF